MVIGSKAQLQSLKLDQFSKNFDSNQIELVNKAKYLGLLVNDYLNWDDHICSYELLSTCPPKVEQDIPQAISAQSM